MHALQCVHVQSVHAYMLEYINLVKVPSLPRCPPHSIPLPPTLLYVQGSHAYILTRTGARKLLAVPADLPTDTLIVKVRRLTGEAIHT